MSHGPVRHGGGDGDVVDGRAQGGPHGDRQPCEPVRRLDAVAIAEALPRVPDVVAHDEDIHAGDEVEVAAPGNVVGLDGTDPHATSLFLTSTSAGDGRAKIPQTARWG